MIGIVLPLSAMRSQFIYKTIGWALDIALVVFICLTDNLTARVLAGAIVAAGLVNAFIRNSQWKNVII